MLTKSLSQLNYSRRQLVIIISFLVAGSILRLLWAADMQWQGDETCMYEQAQLIAQGNLTPTLWCTQHSSIPVPHPYVGVWIFGVIAVFAKDPVSMVRWVQWLNVVTLWLFLSFIIFQIAPSYRRPWLWGLVIASVNPWAIILSRKIWIPDLLAPFCFFVFLGHWFRKRFWGSFIWGMASILSAQVHMSGFFLTTGLFLWTIWQDYRQKDFRKLPWFGYLLGILVGSLPLIPWLLAVLPKIGEQRESIEQSLNLIPRFYLQWLDSALGVNLSNVLWGAFWRDFLKEPLFFGIPTYLMVPAHLFLVGIGLYPLYRWFKFRRRNSYKQPQLNFYFKAMAFGVGGLFTLARVNVHSHYIAIIFPFNYIWLAQLYQNRVKLLFAIAVAQLFISLTFLIFIHRTGGIPFGESVYGLTYRVQMLNK